MSEVSICNLALLDRMGEVSEIQSLDPNVDLELHGGRQKCSIWYPRRTGTRR